VTLSGGQVVRTCARCGSFSTDQAKFCGNCGSGYALASTLPPTERALKPTSVPPPPTAREQHFADPLLGRLIAERYRVLELIGRGGMGVVYKAEHARIGKVLALKLLTGELTRDQEQLARFKREALMSSKLSHPNTVQVFDFGEADGLAYLAMEYVRGRDLGTLVSEAGRLGSERTAKIVIQICSSLSEAHEKGIVHRDLKPENIMVVQSQMGEDVAKVLDFGLAKLRESSELSDVTSSGAIVGTPYYMAPEQIRGEPVGPACDVYALGALLYACLTGTVPFDAATPMGVLTRHLTEEPEPPSSRVPELGLSRSFERLVLIALSKNAADRFPSAAALQAALVDELRGVGDSVAVLLDSQKLRGLTGDDQAATRDEVERYERKLRHRGLVGWSLLGAAGVAALLGGVRVYQTVFAPPAFVGLELEPNNAASEARLLPFPLDVRGHLGQRLDRQRSDRDFFKVTLPADSEAFHLSFAALPNLASCIALYPADSQEPFGRYCLGSAGTDLELRALRLTPGVWTIALMQDREAYLESGPPPVHENVSDEYRFKLEPVKPMTDHEYEPNDAAPLGNTVAVGETLRGALAWARDVDLICAAPKKGRVRFSVEDSPDRPRSRYSVLEATPRGGPDSGVPVRVRRVGQSVKPTPSDVVGTWRGPWIDVDEAAPPCIELVLTPDPWGPAPPAVVAIPGSEEYLVRLEGP
jgi:tRNA A-37 threonylcarbamoyl transferase component Bud32